MKTRVIKLSEIKDKKGFLYRVAKAKIEINGVYFCNINGERVEVIKG